MRALAGFALVLLVALASCRSGDVEPRGGPAPGAPTANVAAPAANVAAAPGSGAAGALGADAEKAARPRPVAPVAPEPWHIPVGITLLIEPGKGLGPIRFGARLETIERLIGEPCEQKRQDSPHVLACRYSAQAVEFFLTDGALTSVHVHRLGRPFGTEPKPDFGIFNGRFVGGVSLGMLMSGVQELLGKPRAVHPVKETNPYGTIEVHDYDGFSLEYDRLDADRVVLGGAVLTAPGSKPAAKPVAAKPAAAKTSAVKPTRR
jgi:hypothetical protein